MTEQYNPNRWAPANNDPYGLGKQPPETAEQREFIQANWPAEPKHNSKKILAIIGVVALVVALGAVTAVAITQHANAVEATALAAKNADQRDDVKAELATTEDDLDSAETAIIGKDAQLESCALVVEMSDHQYEALNLILTASGDYLVNDYSGNEMSEAGDEIDAINAVMEDNGYDSYEALWDACASESSSS